MKKFRMHLKSGAVLEFTAEDFTCTTSATGQIIKWEVTKCSPDSWIPFHVNTLEIIAVEVHA